MNFEFENFDNIKHYPLRTFNRAVTMNNIVEDFGPEAMKKYAEQFTEEDLKAIVLCNVGIKQLGIEAVRKAVTSGVEFDYDPAEEEDVVTY